MQELPTTRMGRTGRRLYDLAFSAVLLSCNTLGGTKQRYAISPRVNVNVMSVQESVLCIIGRQPLSPPIRQIRPPILPLTHIRRLGGRKNVFVTESVHSQAFSQPPYGLAIRFRRGIRFSGYRGRYIQTSLEGLAEISNSICGSFSLTIQEKGSIL